MSNLAIGVVVAIIAIIIGLAIVILTMNKWLKKFDQAKAYDKKSHNQQTTF